MRFRLATLAPLLVGALVFVPRPAAAYCRTTTCNREKDACVFDELGCERTSSPIRWRELPIVYRFSARGSSLLIREETRAAIRAAFHRWSDVVCPGGARTSLRFAEGEDIPKDKLLEPKSRGSEPFGIYFRDLGWPYAGNEDSTLAQTNSIFGKQSGLIEYADIEINTGASRFSIADTDDGVDLQAVVTHEVGHYIGLSHSIDESSIMVSNYCERPEKRCEKGRVAARRLSLDDIDGVCAVYPPEGYEAIPAPQDDGGCSATPSAAPEMPWRSALLAVLAAVGLRRLRARARTKSARAS